MFLILRTKNADTLKQAEYLRDRVDMLGLQPDDVRCPTMRIERRVGRERARVECDVPVLGNFLFLRWEGDLYWANYLERNFHFVTIMRLPHGGYATCSEKEVNSINLLPPLTILKEDQWPVLKVGDNVVVRDGSFLQGIEGKVLKIKKSGEVLVKVLESHGLKLNTLLIHTSLLTISVNASLEAVGDECLTPSET